jgi:nicotinate-nucleotide adenylyltransferase
MMKIGILGGTFNPIHNAHLRVAETTRDRLCLDRIMFIPAATPPHKPLDGEISFEHRRNMVELAIADNPHFTLSDIEQRRGGTSYTIETLRELRLSSPADEFFFIIGSDSFQEISSWYSVADIFSIANIVVVERPEAILSDLISPLPVAIRSEFCYLHNEMRLTHQSGFSVFYLPDTPLAISSSAVRQLIREGRSIRYLVPDRVASYIHEKRIYLHDR